MFEIECLQTYRKCATMPDYVDIRAILPIICLSVLYSIFLLPILAASNGFKRPAYLQDHVGDELRLYPQQSVSGNVSIHLLMNAPLTLPK